MLKGSREGRSENERRVREYDPDRARDRTKRRAEVGNGRGNIIQYKGRGEKTER